MTAAVLGRVPVDEITRRARHAKPGRAALNVYGALWFGLAWAVVMLGKVLWLPLAFTYMACDEGARQALGTRRPGPDLAELRAENARLRAENARLS